MLCYCQHCSVSCCNNSCFGLAIFASQQSQKWPDLFFFELLQYNQQFYRLDCLHEHQHVFILKHMEHYVNYGRVVLRFDTCIWTLVNYFLKFRIECFHRFLFDIDCLGVGYFLEVIRYYCTKVKCLLLRINLRFLFYFRLNNSFLFLELTFNNLFFLMVIEQREIVL